MANILQEFTLQAPINLSICPIYYKLSWLLEVPYHFLLSLHRFEFTFRAFSGYIDRVTHQSIV
jgi:hypothetical protein